MSDQDGKVKDPVCGMWIEPEDAAATAEHGGKTYYFCVEGCREAFEKEPEAYAGEEHGV